MKTNYLLPHKFKLIGWILFVPAFVVAIISFFIEGEPPFLDIKVFAIIDDMVFQDRTLFQWVENNVLDELLSIFLIVGTLFIALSKEKHEDELISKIRLESLLWATYLNFSLLLVSIIFIYGTTFFIVLEVQLVSLLIFFAMRFKWVLYKSNRRLANEE